MTLSRYFIVSGEAEVLIRLEDAPVAILTKDSEVREHRAPGGCGGSVRGCL
eukprot:COSAG01_NODE_4775_length_4751_cov_3.519132_5_plen_51_part_00